MILTKEGKSLKNLNYHHLLYFRSVARHGSFSRAAEQLKVGQPALSMQIKTLEETLETKLIERKRNGLALTDAGEKVLIFANKVFDTGQDLLSSLQGSSLPLEPFHLGAMENIPKSFVAHVASNLCGENAQHRLTIREGSYSKLLRELNVRHLDAAICDSPPRRETGILAKRIATLDVVVCADKKFAQLKKGFPRSLNGAPMIAPSTLTQFRFDLDHYFSIRDVFPNYVVETFDSALQKLLARRALGAIALSGPSAEEFLENPGTVFLGKLQGVHKELWIVYRDASYPHPLLDKLLKTKAPKKGLTQARR